MNFPVFEPDSVEAFLMVAEDLPKLYRYMRLQNLLLPPQYPSGIKIYLQLQIHAIHKPDLPTQKLLLGSFQHAYCGEMHTSITGPFDDSYRELILSKMMPGVHRVNRNRDGWYAWQFLKEMKQEGDLSFRHGNLERAKERYTAYTATFNCRRNFTSQMIHSASDTEWEWQKLAYGLAYRHLFNRILLTIQCEEFDSEITRLGAESLMSNLAVLVGLPIHDQVRMAHCLGLIKAEFGENRSAIRLFMEMLQLSDSPENVAIRESLRLVAGLQEGFPYYGISRRILGHPIPIMEESSEDNSERELKAWRELTEARYL